ncbi:MAG: hypothetical protein ACJ746_09955 [Bryobacteraceae bacterium]
MPLTFVPNSPEYAAAIADFNRRLQERKAPTSFLLSEELMREESKCSIRRQQFLATDSNGVRGGVIELDQPGWLNGEPVRALNYQSPLSEGIADSRYAAVGLAIVKFMQSRSPAAYIVGMGSASNPLPRLLKAAGWTLKDIPFLYRVHKAGSFFAELRPLRSSFPKRMAANIARWNGLGAAVLALKQRSRVKPAARIRPEAGWGDWADELWSRARQKCSFAVQRDRNSLEWMYPAHDPRTRIFLVEKGTDPVGFGVCFDTRMKNNRYFGSMRIGSILDCVALDDYQADTAALVDRQLGLAGCDLVLVNHSHKDWSEAFERAGFSRGPSNYLLGMSKRLTEAVRSSPGGEDRMHITRGDGDGRVHL